VKYSRPIQNFSAKPAHNDGKFTHKTENEDTNLFIAE